MATRTRSSFEKRQREVARQARRKEKEAKREEAKAKKAEAAPDPNAPPAPEEAPDTAGIVPGPQPRQDEGDEGQNEDNRLKTRLSLLP